MNKNTIIHVPNSEDSYAITKNKAIVRIFIGKNEVVSVTLVYIDKYRHMFHDYHIYETSQMQKVASDGRFDTFETSINHNVQLIDYYFRIYSEEELICFGNNVFFDEENRNMEKYYSMPNIKPEDVFNFPDWMDNAVVYQIFPDSFYRGDNFGFVDWNREKRDSSDHLGGTLQGIIDKLDFIEQLGVNVIYMTPVFESPANHKYHTIDYFKIDPRFGTNEKFADLVNLAHQKGMKVILDGVFHSTGIGFFAFQDVIQKGKDSIYWNWFLIEDYPVKTEYPINYKAWGGLRELPNLNMSVPEVEDYILKVMVFWVEKFNIDGWRLDTVDAMSNTILREARKRIYSVKQDCVLVGELWYDARPWLKGDMLDSVMNYLFTKNLISFFAKNQIKPSEFSQGLGWIRSHYPLQAWFHLWNLLSSHDIVRFLSEAENDIERLKMAVLFQFTYPGIPFIYAGDELGMIGHSLINRKGLPWDENFHDHELLKYYQKIGQLRKKYPVLIYGEFQEYIVSDEKNIYAFSRKCKGDEITVFFNLNEMIQKLVVSVGSYDLINDITIQDDHIKLLPNSAIALYRNV